MKKLFFVIFIILSSIATILSLSTFSSAYSSGHIPLLTVSESSNNTEYGGIADLYLVIQPGNGRIFIDSFPLSKLDTQITMRFATEMACDLLDKDCSRYDFFYTITANSALVGGPSAGAAATVLTVALLDNQRLDNKTIMTGTINSGNLIGPVSGVPSKARAAQENGYSRILIPEWDVINNTPDKNLSINVISISTLEEALYYFTGKNYSSTDDLTINISSSEYSKIMNEVTIDLCTKYGGMDGATLLLPNLSSYNLNITNSSQDNFVMALSAINNNSHYSAASFCFGGNVKIRNSLLKNVSKEDLKLIYATLLTNLTDYKSIIDTRSKSISTISELETYMIVAERLYEAQTILADMNLENISTYRLAYALERFDTAVVWSRFFELPGKKFVMDQELLKIVCSKKISEAEERLNYLELYYPSSEIRKNLETAYEYYRTDEYPLCIFTSSKVKADSDIVLSAIFVSEDDMPKLFDEKILAAKIVIAKQAKNNVFPILGYSYYEYANTLRNTDTYSALLYAEYSLELSNIDMYFKTHESSATSRFSYNPLSMRFFFSGLFLGIFISVLILFLIFRFNYSKKKKKR